MSEDILNQLEEQLFVLKAKLAHREQQDLINQTLYEIAIKVSTSSDLDELFKAIHGALSRIIDTTNFFIALYDEKEDSLEFPYAVDAVDKYYPKAFNVSQTSSLTGHVVKTGKALLIDRQGIADFRKNPFLHIPRCSLSEVWLGVPLIIGKSNVGAMAVQSYDNKDLYSQRDVEIMLTVAEQVASAIERQRIKDALVQNEERFRLSMEATNDGLWDWNIPSDEVYYSPSYWSMLGFSSKEEFLDISAWSELIHPDDVARTMAVNQACIDGENDTFQVEFRMKTKKDGWKWIQGRGKAVTRGDDGKAIRLVGTHKDISARKKNEEERLRLKEELSQAQKMESVGRLAGGIAHDFNNMLSVILGHVEMALDDIPVDSVLRNDLLQIETAAQHSAGLTRQLLAFARKQAITPQVLDVNRTIQKLLSMLKRLLGEGIRLDWRPGHSIWSVEIDPGQLEQVLTNLCVNARDAMTGVGKIAIETQNVSIDEGYCVTHAEAVAGDFVKLSVSDEGHGIKPEILPYIFEPFYTTKDIDEGTGLGLATVYGILKQNNSFITTQSDPGKGTTFEIFVPRVLDERKDEKTGDEGEAGKGKETILLVEDEAAILTMASQMLTKQGYNVLTASSPRLALELIKNHGDKVHLVLTDVVMPGMNGKELVDTIQQSCPDIRCLFMSGYTDNVIAGQGVLEDDLHFIQKPFSRSNFLTKVRQVLDL